MGLRRKARELALQFLFGYDFQGRLSSEEEMALALDEFTQLFEDEEDVLRAEERSWRYGHQLVTGLCSHCQDIDTVIAAHSHNWRVERMSLVDRNILRIAVYEMRYSEDVPAQVAINEALEIAKRYSDGESVGFINGILDSIQEKTKTPPE